MQRTMTAKLKIQRTWFNYQSLMTRLHRLLKGSMDYYCTATASIYYIYYDPVTYEYLLYWLGMIYPIR